MADVTKPDADPLISALLTAFIFNLGHLLINGQQRKFIYTLVARFVGTILCVLPGVVVSVLSIIDSYQTAERLKKGETIGENEYSFELLYKIMKNIDSTATFRPALSSGAPVEPKIIAETPPESHNP